MIKGVIIMRWLEKKVEEHNEKHLYSDQDEQWSVSGWLNSIVVTTFFCSVPFIIVGTSFNVTLCVVFGIVCGVFNILWHFWHLIYY